MKRAARSLEQGSALVFVLWIALLVSVLAAGAVIAARERVIEARVENQVMREAAALRGALEITAWTIALQGRDGLTTLPRTISVGDYSIDVRLAASHGRIDVNLADETAWMRVFAAVGAREAIARTLTDEILDWRDSDAAARPFGAERADYVASQRKIIGDRPFATIGELAQVRSMTPRRLDCIRPYLTVFGGTGPIQGAPRDDEFTPPQRADGVRAALAATVIGPDGTRGRRLEGLVQYGVSETRPYEWVRFGSGDGVATLCDSSVF